MTPRFEPLADVVVDKGEDDEPRPLRDFQQNPVEMALTTHHRPEMLDRLDTLKLGEPGLGNIFERLAGRVRKEMEVQADHVCSSTDVEARAGTAVSALLKPKPPIVTGMF